MKGWALLPWMLLALAAPAATQELPADQAALKAHVQFLASDAMRGREAGSPEYDIAAEYMAAQMAARGLKPGANGAWFQPLKLANYRASEKSKWTLTRGGQPVPLQFGVDYASGSAGGLPSFAVEAGMVFAGYGLVYPQGKIDDYKGLNVRGKIVVLMSGSPKGLPNEVAAHFGDDQSRIDLASARGARAVIMLESSALRAEYPFEMLMPYWDQFDRDTWASEDGRVAGGKPGAPDIGYVSMVGAAKLFAGSRIKWADVLAAEKSGTPMSRGALAGTLAASTKAKVALSDTRSVVGLLEGSDPALRHEYIVLSAHLDHVGIGDPVNGDTIYNGAMDNAVGNSVMLEVAAAFQKSGIRPRRSILFVSLAAEEIGLIGSDYFAHNPVVPKAQIVADINMDLPILTYPLEDVIVLGGERSSLGPVIAKAAAAEGLKVVPDPSPEEMFFVRSDHYSFVKAGIPAVSIDTGPGGAGAVAQKKFLDENYHKPSDQIDLPFDWNSAARFARLNYAVARAVADADQRPSWKKGDFFGLLFDGYGAK